MPSEKEKSKSEREKDLKRNVVLTEHKEDLGDMSKRLETNYDKGLTAAQVKAKQEKWGPNMLTPPPETHICIKFILELTDFFSLLLWTGGILCFVGYSLQKVRCGQDAADNLPSKTNITSLAPPPQSKDNLYLGIVLFFVVLATGIFSFVQNQKSDSLMKSFANMLPPKVLVLRDGETSFEDAVGLVPGDVVEVRVGAKHHTAFFHNECHLPLVASRRASLLVVPRPNPFLHRIASLIASPRSLQINAGDLVPADVRILECSDNLVVDNASLTGEAEPQKRKKECTHDDPLETQNLCFFGTQIPEGSCKGVVISTGDNTVMGRIATLAMATDNEQTPINKELENFIHIISGIAMFLGISFLIINAIRGVNWITNLVFMIGIIVANVPEGLITTVTVCLTLTANRMHTKMVLVKNLEGVETLGSTSCICSDKTGTLTQNIMTVAQIVYGGKNGFSIEDCEVR